MSSRCFHVARDLLDHEVVDVDGMPCGIVDDVELSLAANGALAIEALLLGPGGWCARLPRVAARLVASLAGDATTRIPWSRVARLGEHVVLDAPAAVFGLDRGERRFGRWIAKLPGA